MENMTLKDILDLGSNGVMIFFVIMLWNRLNGVIDRLFKYLEQGAAERAVIAQTQGLSTQDLSQAAAEVRQRRLEQRH